MISHMTQREYLFIGLSLLLIGFFFYKYFSVKRRNRHKENMLKHLRILQKSFDISKDAMLILSTKNEVIYANKSMIKLFNLDENYLLKVLKNIPEIKVRNTWVVLDTFIGKNRTRLTDTLLTFPHILLKVSDDDEIPINLSMDTISIGKSYTTYYKVISIEDLRKEEGFLTIESRHELTDLPDMKQVFKDLPAFYSKVHLEKNKIALILLKLDNFTRLRSIVGYEESNEVLKKFAKYLTGIAEDLNLSVYHTFDNHFLLTVTKLKSIDAARKLVEDIQLELVTFYKKEDVNLHLTVSAGISIYPDSGPIRKLFDYTYKALAKGEDQGDNRITVFLPEEFAETYDELTLHNYMQRGLDKGEFEVYYQPIIRVENEEVIGAEALIRWKHPQYGMIPPDVFIPLMEKTGFIIKLGQFVLEEVLKQQKRWELFKFKQIEVSINVSMVEIATGEFAEYVEEKLIEHQVNPEIIKFEITEGVAMISESETVKYFIALKKLGVGISLDDFGTGYTSFGYLKKFPADTLKIDKSLVDYILTNEDDQRIVKAMIELGHTLGMKIIVEGIENKKMVEIIASYGCDYMQGYYFDKPLPVFEFQKLLR
ncbi:MAG: GGDEF domain-containing protein [Sulfurovum sp.]|nr:MAG: GGDEF domain-containing protein [Sulfurovum sp.]